MECFVSLHYTNPWYLRKILRGGWPGCLRMAWIGPNRYGLA